MATNKNDALFNRLMDLFQNGVGVARKTKGALDHKPGYNPRYMGIAGSSGVGHFKNHSPKKNTRNTFNHVMNPHAAHRQSRYQEYEQMEETAEIHTALNVMASEVTATDEKGKCFHIQTDNERIKELLGNLFYDVLNIEFNLYWYVRSLCKFGDFCLYNRIDNKRGIIGVTPIPINEIEREEDFNLDEPQMVQFHWSAKGGDALHSFQVTHMRLNGNESFMPFGTSMLEGARKTWRQLTLAEDAMLVYRVVRSPERRVFYVDTANVPAADVGPFLEQMRNALRSSQVVDQTSGRVDLRYNPFSQEEDYFIPIRGGDSGTKIDTLSGGANTTATEDVEYIQKKLFSALQVPKAFLGFDDSLSSKATLALEDVRFAKTVQNIQKVVLAELNKLAYIHLFIHGFEGEDLVNFDLQLSNPSTIAQQQKLELLRTRLEIVKNNYDPEMRMLSREYFQRNILEMSEGEIENERTRIEFDKKFDSRIDAIEQKAARSGPYSDGFDGKTYGYGEDNKKPEAALDSAKPTEEKASVDSLSTIKKPSDEEDGDDGFIRPPQSLVKPEDRVAYNRNRRHTHGPRALAQPDFRSMLSVKNSSLKDIYDKDFLGRNNPFREGKEIDMENIFEPDGIPLKSVSSPTITKEIEIMLKTMDEHLNISRQWSSVNSNLLAEGNSKDED